MNLAQGPRSEAAFWSLHLNLLDLTTLASNSYSSLISYHTYLAWVEEKPYATDWLPPRPLLGGAKHRQPMIADPARTTNPPPSPKLHPPLARLCTATETQNYWCQINKRTHNNDQIIAPISLSHHHHEDFLAYLKTKPILWGERVHMVCTPILWVL